MEMHVSPEERMWFLGAFGAVIAWFARTLGLRHRKRRDLGRENDTLRASLSQVLAACDVLLVAMELPDADLKGKHVERAKGLIEDARRRLFADGACPPAQEDFA